MPTYRIWPATDGPGTEDNADPVTLGTRFTLSATGWATHIHYWRSSANDTGTHNAAIFKVSDGSVVPGTAVVAPASGTGWQTVALPAPVQLDAATMYCVAVHHPDGHPPFTGSYWVVGGPGASGITNGILTAPNSADASGQGVFNGGSSLAHPTGSFNQTNYWVDVSVTDENPNTISPTGIPPATAAGTPSLTPGAVTIRPTGIGSAAEPGAPAVTLGPATISPAGVPSAATAGQPALTPGPVTVNATGIAPSLAAGQPALTPGPVTITPDGIPASGGQGQPTLTPAALTVAPAGIASTEAVGQPELAQAAVTIAPVGIAPANGVGQPAITAGPVTLTPIGIPAGAAVGQPRLSDPDIADPDWDFAFGPPYTDSFRLGPPHL